MRAFLRGHAWLSDADRRADGVLLTLRQGDGERRVVDAKRARVWRLPETVVLERGPDGARASETHR